MVQLNTRIAFSYRWKLSNLSAERRQTIRSHVEQALGEAYGQEGRSGASKQAIPGNWSTVVIDCRVR